MCSRSCGNGTVSPQAMHFSAGHSYGIIKIQCLLLYGECMGLGMQDCTDGTVTFMIPCMLTVTHNYHPFLPTSWESSSLPPLEWALLYTSWESSFLYPWVPRPFSWSSNYWISVSEPLMVPQWRCWWAKHGPLACMRICLGLNGGVDEHVGVVCIVRV